MKRGAILFILVLSSCATTEPWRQVRPRIECRHYALAWVEEAERHGIEAELVYYMKGRDLGEGVPHAIVVVNDGADQVFLDPSGIVTRRVELSVKERQSIFYMGRQYR